MVPFPIGVGRASEAAQVKANGLVTGGQGRPHSIPDPGISQTRMEQHDRGARSGDLEVEVGGQARELSRYPSPGTASRETPGSPTDSSFFRSRWMCGSTEW